MHQYIVNIVRIIFSTIQYSRLNFTNPHGQITFSIQVEVVWACKTISTDEFTNNS